MLETNLTYHDYCEAGRMLGKLRLLVGQDDGSFTSPAWIKLFHAMQWCEAQAKGLI